MNALVEHGGDYMHAGLPESIAAAFIAVAANNGETIDEAKAWDNLAKSPDALANALAGAKAGMPEHFIDVSRFDRIPSPMNRLMEKTQAIMKARDSRRAVGKLQQHMISRSARQHRPI